MTVPRFFIDADLAEGVRVTLPVSTAHHATHVLRLREGDDIVLFNGRGGEYRAVLAARRAQADIGAFVAVERESPVAVTLLQAWIAIDKLDWVVEKAVELGVARIGIAPARRSVVRLDAARRAKRVDRLQEIAIAACCQCGRNRVPAIDAFESFTDALAAWRAGGGLAFVLHPEASEALLSVVQATSAPLTIIVGPEGGFDAQEILAFGRAEVKVVDLGPRVLRTETAGLAALAAVQAVAGDFRAR